MSLGQTRFVPGTIPGTKGGTESLSEKSLCAFFARYCFFRVSVGVGAPAKARGGKRTFLFLQFGLQCLTLLGKPVLDRRLRPTAKDVQNNADLLAPKILLCNFQRMARVCTLVLRNAHVIVFEGIRFGKLQGICHLNTLCFACFNSPSTSQRSNVLVSSNPDGLLHVPLVGWPAHAEPHDLHTWLRRKPAVKMFNHSLSESFCGINHI